MAKPGEIIRSRRRHHGLSQAALALRVSTSQAAISRLERGELSPTFDTFNTLLLVMGERAVVTTEHLPYRGDPVHLAAERKRTPEERLCKAFAWNRFASQITGKAREDAVS